LCEDLDEFGINMLIIVTENHNEAMGKFRSKKTLQSFVEVGCIGRSLLFMDMCHIFDIFVES